MKKVVFVVCLFVLCCLNFCYVSLKNIFAEAEHVYYISNYAKNSFENGINLGKVSSLDEVYDKIVSELEPSVNGIVATFDGSLSEVNELFDKIGAVVVKREYDKDFLIISGYSKRVPFCCVNGKNVEVVVKGSNIAVGFPMIFK